MFALFHWNMDTATLKDFFFFLFSFFFFFLFFPCSVSILCVVLVGKNMFPLFIVV